MQPIKIAQHLPIYNKKHHKKLVVLFAWRAWSIAIPQGNVPVAHFRISIVPPAYNKKTPQKIVVFFCLARLKGLEPPTYWFVASHSIQLSYKRRCYCSADGICIAISFTIVTSKKSFVKGFWESFLKFFIPNPRSRSNVPAPDRRFPPAPALPARFLPHAAAEPADRGSSAGLPDSSICPGESR